MRFGREDLIWRVRAGWKVVGLVCLTGFMACSDDRKPSSNLETYSGAGGHPSAFIICPTSAAELQRLAGKPCEQAGTHCLALAHTACEAALDYECVDGTWTPLPSATASNVAASCGGAGTGTGGATPTEVPSAGEGGLAAAGDGTGGDGAGGDGGVAGEGGTSGEGGIVAVGGDGSASVGEGGAMSPPLDPASIALLAIEQRPYTECATYKLGADYARDGQGIPLKLYRGTFYYNPVLTAQAGLEWLACYREGGDAWYLEQARRAGQHLVDTSNDFDGAMFFPYEFDFHLHGSSSNIARAPWYSGMAQGQVLSLLSRLGELTAEAEWELAAAATLRSFERRRGQSEPWIVDVDADNSLWIEEYAAGKETHVLNGFIFALFGIYDYYAWQQDERAALVFRQGIHTLRVNLERFRNPGEVSAYCLTHRVQSESYHRIHIGQLRALSLMTDDAYFATVADLFALDHAP